MVHNYKINNMHLQNRLNFHFMLTLRTNELFLQTQTIISIKMCIVLLTMHHWKCIYIFESRSNSSNWKSQALHDIQTHNTGAFAGFVNITIALTPH